MEYQKEKAGSVKRSIFRENEIRVKWLQGTIKSDLTHFSALRHYPVGSVAIVIIKKIWENLNSKYSNKSLYYKLDNFQWRQVHQVIDILQKLFAIIDQEYIDYGIEQVRKNSLKEKVKLAISF